MDLIPIHANPERDWCKRTKPYGCIGFSLQAEREPAPRELVCY
jgi:hypothetical protein